MKLNASHDLFGNSGMFEWLQHIISVICLLRSVQNKPLTSYSFRIKIKTQKSLSRAVSASGYEEMKLSVFLSVFLVLWCSILSSWDGTQKQSREWISSGYSNEATIKKQQQQQKTGPDHTPLNIKALCYKKKKNVVLFRGLFFLPSALMKGQPHPPRCYSPHPQTSLCYRANLRPSVLYPNFPAH